MPRNRTSSLKAGQSEFGRVVLGAAAAALILCSSASFARAGGDDDNQSFTDKFLTTLGLKNPGSAEYGINYSERSPLVVPPTRNLPPPMANGPPPVPDWPKDPDVIRSKEAKYSDKVVTPQTDYVVDSQRPLRPDELNVGRSVTPRDNRPGTPDQNPPADPAAKKSLFSLFQKQEQYATFTGEPARGSLTDPPPGYLTPSPDQPYGVGPEKAHYHVPTPSDHGEPVR